MTSERLEELNEQWNKINNVCSIITLFRNIESGGNIATSTNRAYVPTEVVEKILATLWQYSNQLDNEFREM